MRAGLHIGGAVLVAGGDRKTFHTEFRHRRRHSKHEHAKNRDHEGPADFLESAEGGHRLALRSLVALVSDFFALALLVFAP
jgi:hypothetical protein